MAARKKKQSEVENTDARSVTIIDEWGKQKVVGGHGDVGKSKKASKDEVEDDEPLKLPKHYVRHEGNTIKCVGKDVQVSADVKVGLHGIKAIEGRVGGSCEVPVTLTFGSSKQAQKFFEECLNNESDEDSLVDSGGRAQWMGPSLGSAL